VSLQVTDLEAAERRAELLAAGPEQGSAGCSPATLPAPAVAHLVDALWGQLASILGDAAGLADALADEGACELRGRLGCAHLAALLSAGVHR
jgi:hypothetical protein